MNYLQFSTEEGERVSFILSGNIVFVIYHEEEVQDRRVKWQYERLLEKTREEWSSS